MVQRNGRCRFGSSRGDRSHSKRRRLSTRGHVGTPRTGEQSPKTVLTELRVGGTRPREKSQSTCGFSAWRENSDTIKLIPAEARANHSIKPAQNLMSDIKTAFIENALVRNGKVHIKGGTVKRSPGPQKRRERLPKVVTFLLLCLTQIFTKQKPQRKPRTLCRKNEVFGSQVHRGLDARSMVADGLMGCSPSAPQTLLPKEGRSGATDPCWEVAALLTTPHVPHAAGDSVPSAPSRPGAETAPPEEPENQKADRAPPGVTKHHFSASRFHAALQDARCMQGCGSGHLTRLSTCQRQRGHEDMSLAERLPREGKSAVFVCRRQP